MNKIKSLFLAVALVLGVGAAYAFSVADEPPCFVIGSIGYEAPYTSDGVPPNPDHELRILGTYQPITQTSGDYECLTNPSSTCRYVFAVTEEAPNGRWFTCTGDYNEF